jgi:hypothetical protein
LSNCIPSTNSRVVCGRLALLDGDDAVAADALDGIGQHVPMVGSLLAEMAPDLRDLLLAGDLARDALELGDGRLDGLLDARGGRPSGGRPR